MDIILVLIAGVAIGQAALYARVTYLRRHIMLPKVMSYLERADASVVQKKLAQDAFLDALSFSMPLKVLREYRRRKNMDKNISPELKKLKENIIRHCEENTSANCELMDIISLMFMLNFRFNFVLHIYAGIKRCSISNEVPSEAKEAYAKLRYQHQS
ncbi:hypothetical protein A4L20_07140 [Salmonella enterica subsp. enterica serovar Telelkebir]|nr:hypothetical protein [Salmonella enterica subsp. enterica serovar Telelkebir]ECZ9741633.1 hypothetical protein [Salmonella enterica subsp. enterica serovar Telelkebir]MIN79528.1 hypothetical protein [Salmonella enterica subsp. enterica]